MDDNGWPEIFDQDEVKFAQGFIHNIVRREGLETCIGRNALEPITLDNSGDEALSVFGGEILIVKDISTVKTIAGSKQTKVFHVLREVIHPGNRWHPDETDWIDVGTYFGLEQACRETIIAIVRDRIVNAAQDESLATFVLADQEPY